MATRVSILIPLYNEEEFVGTLLKRVLKAPLPEGVRREFICGGRRIERWFGRDRRGPRIPISYA